MSDDNGINESDNVPMALFIDEMMEDHPLTDEEVATRIGYSAAEIRMFRQGTVKVAFDVIPDLADAIGADRRGLMERALREYLPELVSTLIDLYGTFTEDQWKIIKMIGELNGLWESGGGGGIRTRDTVSRMHAFQACALNHSATPPGGAHPSEAVPMAQ